MFIDKDGTLITDIPYNVNPELLKFEDGVIEGLRTLQDAGFLLIVVSNQAGIAYGYFSEAELFTIRKKMEEVLQLNGITLNGFYFCPHHPSGTLREYTKTCDCRKPEPGMLIQAAKEFDIDITHSWMIGDILHDVEAGNKAGCRSILINNGNETEWVLDVNRQPEFITSGFLQAAFYISEIVAKSG